MNIKQDIQDFYHCKNWYAESLKVLQELYGDSARLFAACLAATSPKQTVKGNWKLAKKAFNRILLRWKQGGINEYFDDFMPAHRKNLQKIYHFGSTVNLKSIDLSGPKVNAFYHNLIGDLSFVTVDVWMFRYFNLNKCETDRKATVQAIKEYANVWHLQPAELQAILWSAIRARSGLKPATFLIASVDDFQLLFDFAK